MQTIYCISGLGADERTFQYLDLSFAEPVFIKWITPCKNETLQAYAMRLKDKFIPDENPVIVGLSLGGMIAVEIAKTLPAAHAIIISSAKTRNEVPYYWKAFKYFPLYKILPEWSVKRQTLVRNYILSSKSLLAKNYVHQVAKDADIKFYRWAIGAILNWQNQIIPPNVIHIHGTSDKLLPNNFVKADFTINNGGHLMVIENASEVSSKLKQILVREAFEKRTTCSSKRKAQ